MTHWEPIETAPKDGTWVLLRWRWTLDGGLPAIVGRWHNGWRDDDGRSYSDSNFTYWMPLPAPPEPQS